MGHRTSKHSRSLVFAALLSLTIALPALASEIHVPGDYPTVAAGLAAVEYGQADTLTIAPGTYYESEMGTAPYWCVIRGATGDPADVVIDAQGGDYILDIYDGMDFSIEGITFTGVGDADAQTGVAAIKMDSDVLDHSYRRCAFLDNFGIAGGLVIATNYGKVLVEDCLFQGNEAMENGGGIYIAEGSPVIQGCRFVENHAALKGGAIYMTDRAWLLGCTFDSNSAPLGGAIYQDTAWLYIDSCTLSGNSAATAGAGLYVEGHDLHTRIAVLDRSIIAFSPEGAAFHVDESAILVSTGTDIHGNAGGDWINPYATHDGRLGNSSIDPLFCSVGEGDFGLLPGSPCLPDGNYLDLLVGAWGEGCDQTAVPAGNWADAPAWLMQNHPNPFNPSTRITFTLPRTGQVRLRIFDPSGALVVTLVDGRREAGPHRVTWNGCDDEGRRLPSGAYFYQLEAEGISEAKQMLMLK